VIIVTFLSAIAGTMGVRLDARETSPLIAPGHVHPDHHAHRHCWFCWQNVVDEAMKA
jgi:hypothetical protein